MIVWRLQPHLPSVAPLQGRGYAGIIFLLNGKWASYGANARDHVS